MTTDDTIRGLEPAGWRYKYSGISKKWTVQKNKPAWHKPQMADVALEPLYSADALRTLTAQLDEARAGEAHWKANYNGLLSVSKAAEARLEELTRERDRCHARLEIDHAFVLKNGELERYEIPLEERTAFPDAIMARDATISLVEHKAERLAARLEEAKAVLEPFDEMHETASKLSDLHGENEFILSFGPAVVVGVLPFDAIHKVHAFLRQGGSDAR